MKWQAIVFWGIVLLGFVVCSSFGQTTQPNDVAEVQRHFGIPAEWPASVPTNSWVFPPGICPHPEFFDGAGDSIYVRTFKQVIAACRPLDGVDAEWAVWLTAVAMVESHGNPDAVGGQGDIGLFQIRPIYFADVERIFGADRSKDFATSARDVADASQLVILYTSFWGNLGGFTAAERRTRENRVTNVKLFSSEEFERFAMIHHGGPNGDKNPFNKKYAEAVMTHVWHLRHELFPVAKEIAIPVPIEN